MRGSLQTGAQEHVLHSRQTGKEKNDAFISFKFLFQVAHLQLVL